MPICILPGVRISPSLLWPGTTSSYFSNSGWSNDRLADWSGCFMAGRMRPFDRLRHLSLQLHLWLHVEDIKSSLAWGKCFIFLIKAIFSQIWLLKYLKMQNSGMFLVTVKGRPSFLCSHHFPLNQAKSWCCFFTYAFLLLVVFRLQIDGLSGSENVKLLAQRSLILMRPSQNLPEDPFPIDNLLRMVCYTCWQSHI